MKDVLVNILPDGKIELIFTTNDSVSVYSIEQDALSISFQESFQQESIQEQSFQEVVSY